MAPSAAKKSPAKKSPAKKANVKKPLAGEASAKKSPAKTSAAKAARSAPRKAAAKYTDPALRERIKQDVMAGDKGGNPGQWSARKAQLVAHEYEAEGGGYKGGRDETQKSLKDWGDEHWTTKDGEPAKRDDGMHRYLPKKAWKELTPTEKASTDKKKLKGSEDGKQFVANTTAAKSVRKRATKQ